MTDDDECPTNYDDLMVAGENGVVPGERSMAVAPSTVSTPARPAEQGGRFGVAEVVEVREVAQGPDGRASVEMMKDLMQQMIQQQASQMEASQKAMEQNVMCIKTLGAALTEKNKGEKRNREETADERLNGDEPIMVDYGTLEKGEGKDR